MFQESWPLELAVRVSEPIDQQQRKRTSSCPVQNIEQSKRLKLTIDTNLQLMLYKALHFSEGPCIENCINILN
jgi:hypothetical protein